MSLVVMLTPLLTPLLKAALTVGVGYMTLLIKRKLDVAIGEDVSRALENAAVKVVDEFENTVVKNTKAANNGKLTMRDVASIQTQAVARVRRVAGPVVVNEVKRTLKMNDEDVNQLIKNNVEAWVMRNK